MSTPAKVYSSESIEAVRMALMSFSEQVGDALTELSAEMRRMQEWLDHDRPRHWKMQVRKAMDAAHEAQQALHRCLMFPIANERPSCTEERMALKKAKARLEYCQEKEDRVREWQQTLRHEMFEYDGRISQLVRLVEIEVPQAIGVLNKILRNLEEYHAIRARDPRAAYDDVSMANAIWDDSASGDEAENEAADGEPAATKKNGEAVGGSIADAPKETN
jgi:exonuclease VII large subunit